MKVTLVGTVETLLTWTAADITASSAYTCVTAVAAEGRLPVFAGNAPSPFPLTLSLSKYREDIYQHVPPLFCLFAHSGSMPFSID